MVFSSNAFLFFFLPAVLILYYIVRRNRTAANAVLTVMSLLFYAWGEPKFVLVMLLSIAVNWAMALLIEKNERKQRVKKACLTVGIVVNVLILGVFKYASFAIRNLNSVFKLGIVDPGIALPIGISFFTFQAMSYIIDVYRGKGKAQKHFMGVCLYISFFPQLIAGPIVRYETVADQLVNRRESVEDFTCGVRRFMVGFCKKAILANTLARLVDYVYALESGRMSVCLGWIAAAAYLIQVYYDFSGYSDMAIGLGRMFGFHFLENFNLPFIAKSVTEFWRRWHISMCTWFRDYVFFPLGGSRVKSRARLLFNMFAVWALTGLWHGAEWTFVCWGVGFFAVLAVEKLTGLGKWMEKHALGHLYAMLVVVVITVLIRAQDISSAGRFYKTMFGLDGAPFFDGLTWFLLKEYLWYLIAAVVCALPLADAVKKKLRVPDGAWQIVSGAALLVLMLIAVGDTVAGGYNPFIYYNF
ncbi:MAG: MBOAT family protein [Clostridia bacterium]|nr:MBOAT family protein [Clostridia bacterium]